jgi:hypothetical protein
MTPERVKEIEELFAGKTIKRLDASCVNSWVIEFTDGTFHFIDIVPSEDGYGRLELDKYV